MPTRRVPAEIWVLVASSFLIALGYGIVAPVLPQFARSFNVSFFAASAIVSAFALARLAFAPAGGSLIARFGERRIYLIGLIIVAVSSLASGLTPNYLTLLIVRGLGGIGSVMFTVSSMGLLVRLAPPEQRGQTSSLYATSFLVGNIAGPILGSSLQAFGMRAPFFIYAAMVFLATLVVALFLRGETAHPTSPGTERPKLSLREALAIPGFRVLLLSGFASGWANFGVRIALIPLMAGAITSIGEGAAGVALTLFALGNAVAQQFSGRLTDRYGRQPFLVLGLELSALATVGFGWATNLWAFHGLSVLAGVGAAFFVPAAQALLADLIGNQRSGGQALSAYSMSTDLGSITGTLLAGAIADALGFGWAFVVTAAVLGAAAVPWLFVRTGGR